MVSDRWLTQDHELKPGAALFRSDRYFSMEAYSASHSQLLLRSNPAGDENGTTIDLLFKPVDAVKIQNGYAGLAVRCATTAEANAIVASMPGVRVDRGLRVFVLESQGSSDYVISMAFGWHEGILPPLPGSFFNTADAYSPQWPTKALSGLDPGLNVASLPDLVDELRSSRDRLTRRDRYRVVYVLMVDADDDTRPHGSGSGVFLTRQDAEAAQAFLAPKVRSCRIEMLPVFV